MRWTSKQLIHEAMLNVTNRRGLDALLMIALVLAATLGVAVGVEDTNEHLKRVNALVESGWATVVLESEDGGVERSSCDGLTRFEGVLSSGWFERRDPVEVPAFPGRAISEVSMSPGLFRFLAPFDALPGSYPDVLIGTGLVSPDRRGPQQIFVDGRQATAVVAPALNGVGLAGSLVAQAVSPENGLAGCITVFDPRQAREAPWLLAGIVGSVEEPPVARRATNVGAIEPDPMGDFRRRPRKWAAHVLLGLAGLFGSVSARARRGEFAVYLLGGTSRSDLTLLLILESLLMIAAATLVAGAALAMTIRLAPGMGPRSLGMASALATSALILTMSRATVAATTSVERSLKER